MSDRIFQNSEAQHRLEAWYQRFLERVRVPVEHREVMTTHGGSHVLVAGNPGQPPLVCLHGSLASSAHVVSELGPLVERFQVFAPDLPGQSVRGPQVRLPLNDDSLAKWLVEVLEGLGLDEVGLLGVSWGGFVALQTAAFAPGRIRHLVLIVPAGVVTGPAWEGITRILLPMLLYQLAPSEHSLRRFVGPLMTTWDDDWAHYFGDAIRSFVLDMRVPPLVKPETLRRFTSPTLVFGASHDLSFPGDRLIARIREIIPHAQTELIPNSRHAPPMTDAFRYWMADRVTTFLGY